MNNPSRQEVEACRKRATKRIIVKEIYDDSPDFPEDVSYLQLHQWISAQVKNAPESYLQDVRVSIYSDTNSFDDPFVRFTFYYERLETEDEWQARKDDVAHRLKAWADAETETYRLTHKVLSTDYANSLRTDTIKASPPAPPARPDRAGRTRRA